MHIERLREDDKKYIWHPFTQMKLWCEEEEPIIITEGSGPFLKDITGKWYLDGVSSLWCNVHGHRRREIDEAIKRQIDKISHSTLLGLTHPPAIELAKKLVNIAPEGLKKVFYSDDGSTSVEVAIKMAYQYFQLKGEKQRMRFVSLKNAYHGDTLGAVSVGGIDLFHNIFSPLLFNTLKTPSPYCYRCELGAEPDSCHLLCLKEAEKIVDKHHKEIAAFIIEPMVQGAGGMITYPRGFLKGIENICRDYGILLIADEVATGFGRTGRMFACEHEDVRPDLLCLSKGITGGYLPLGATLTTEEIYNAFLGEYEELKTFFHGHTYTGNQLSSAAAIANLDIFEKEDIINVLQDKIIFLGDCLKEMLVDMPHVGQVRQCGFMVGIELVEDKYTKSAYPLSERMGQKVCYKAREEGLIIRPLGDVVVLMPPLCCKEEELKIIVEITDFSIRDVTS